MLSLSKAMKLIVALVTVGIVETRVNSRSNQYPACYTDASDWTADSSHDCKHPLYTSCRLSSSEHLCCGPDHFCCNGYASCCRSQPWTTYEIVGMVTGIASWVCLLVVLCICCAPHFVQKARKLCKRRRKVSPQH